MDEYLGIKICILLAECYLALNSEPELEDLVENLVTKAGNIFANVLGRRNEELKEDVPMSIFPPITLGSYLFEQGRMISEICP